MFLTKTDLTSIIYEEDIDTITEGDDSKVDSAIGAAIDEAQECLSRFDIPTIFAKTGADRHHLLLESCKAIACWYLVKLCPANQSTKEIIEGATFARQWLDKINNGKKPGIGFPLKPEPPTGLNTFFHASSFEKRHNNL